MCKACKSLPFYAEIVKFGLILAHLKLFWGKGGNIILGENAPYAATTASLHAITSACLPKGLMLPRSLSDMLPQNWLDYNQVMYRGMLRKALHHW